MGYDFVAARSGYRSVRCSTCAVVQWTDARVQEVAAGMQQRIGQHCARQGTHIPLVLDHLRPFLLFFGVEWGHESAKCSI
jgi:hypothetical protein